MSVTPQRVAPSRIAQSSAEGPRSPRTPGCTIRHTPNVFGNGALEVTGDDEVGGKQRDGVASHGIVDVELDRDEMAALAQLHMQALGQAVERMTEQEDAHRRSADARQLLA